MTKQDRLFMVFDAESVGLHGEGFAVGFVVVTANGFEVTSGRYVCPPDTATGDEAGRAWIAAHVLPGLPHEDDWTHVQPALLRTTFWHHWRNWQAQGATLWADCAWPVEARFLAACVDDDPVTRAWAGPYPLHDVATLMLAAGNDPLATYERLPNELPAHDPLADARQSARLLVECLGTLGEGVHR